MASRIHFQIETRDGNFWLIDLESMNGTSLNGQLVKESKLSSGDLINVGDTRISFLTDDTSVGALAGHRMGGYRIVERIGRGGMGIVYKAEQVDLQREVALKVLSEENGTDKEFINLFVHEARASAKLNHPHIVQVYDVKRHGTVYYFSMEYVSGGSLQDLLNQDRKVDPEKAIKMILDASRGLEYAHSKGFVHRDIKPDNLMISEEGQIKIADLGLARRVDENVGPSEEHVVFGTPHYIAPEQVLGRPADFRSDIYSLGSTAYRMLAGTTPYQAPGIRDLVSKKVKEDPKLLHEVAPDIPRELSDLVHQMMARDPERRFGTTAEVCTELEKIQKQLFGEGDVSSTSSGPVPGLVGNRLLLISTLSLLIIVVVGAVIGASGLFQSEPEIVPEPEKRPNHELALSIMQTAKRYGLFELDRTDENSLRKGINEYQVVIDNFGVSQEPSIVKIVDEAQKLKADLELDLRELQARILLADVEKNVVVNWRSLQNKPEELLLVDQSIQLYTDFSLQPEVKGTWALTVAGKRESHLLRWKTEAGKWRSAYKKLLGEIARLEDQQEYREADLKLREFQDNVIRGKLECPVEECGVPEERFHFFLLDYEIARYIETLRAIAMGEYFQIERRVNKFLAGTPSSSQEFDEVLQLLQPVIEKSLGDTVDLARSLLYRVTTAQGRWAYLEAERVRSEQRAVKDRARLAFRAGCQKAHELVLQYQFRDALKKLRARSGEGAIPPYEGLFREKLQLIGRLVLLIDGIQKEFQLKTFRKAFSFPRMNTEGRIHSLKETYVSVRLPSSGVITFNFNQFQPLEFYSFVRAGYKKLTPQLSCNLAAYCMEFGLYEQARKELQSVRMMEAYQEDKSLRSFVDSYLAMVDGGTYTESDEVEAKKRVDRVRRFMSEKDYSNAQSEIDVLQRNFGGTRAFGEAREYIQGVLNEIGVKSSEQDRQLRYEVLYAHFETELERTGNELDVLFNQVTTRIRESKKLKLDPMEQYFQLGDSYAAYGKLVLSNDYWKKARRLIKATGKEKFTSDTWDRLVYLQFGMARNQTLSGDSSRAHRTLEEVKRQLESKNHSIPKSVQDSFGPALELWKEGGLGRIREEIRRTQKKISITPDDPALYWRVAEVRYRKLDDPAGALGYYLYLAKNFSQYEKVKKGEVQAAIAGIWFRLKVLDKAQESYRNLEDVFPDNWRNKNQKGKSYTQARIISCQNLAARIGWTLP
ncbi:MAG: FHA domain-containing serine/threonine-protein kinase, partial [Planctomycetota bacterium]|nr:FHA domain-containing serine/threonine-protein kinase [Planctomycetota bacterium]